MYNDLTFGDTLKYAYQNIVVKLVQYLPFLLTAIIILILGWIVAGLVARALNRLLRILKVDDLFKQAKVDEIVKATGSKRDAVGLIAHIVKWILLLVVFMATVQALQIPAVSEFFDNVIAYTPNVLAAILILLLWAILPKFSYKVN